MINELEKIVKDCGNELIYWKKKSFETKIKKNKYDLVTELDIKTQNYLIQSLKNKFPNIEFYAEEEGLDKKPESNKYWLIDPIDGTVNFSKGMPEYCISIAYVENNEPIIGIIYSPEMDLFFKAEKNNGVYLNNKKITVSKENDLEKMMIYIANVRGETFKYIKEIEEKVMRIRLLGSAALQIAYVAAGFSELFISFKSYPWDIAAGYLILKEAGGIITDFKGNKSNIFSKKALYGTKESIKNIEKYTKKW